MGSFGGFGALSSESFLPVHIKEYPTSSSQAMSVSKLQSEAKRKAKIHHQKASRCLRGTIRVRYSAKRIFESLCDPEVGSLSLFSRSLSLSHSLSLPLSVPYCLRTSAGTPSFASMRIDRRPCVCVCLCVCVCVCLRALLLPKLSFRARESGSCKLTLAWNPEGPSLAETRNPTKKEWNVLECNGEKTQHPGARRTRGSSIIAPR